MIRVLLVEDDPVIRDTTCYFLKSQQNFEVVCAETGGDEFLEKRENINVILNLILPVDPPHEIRTAATKEQAVAHVMPASKE